MAHKICLQKNVLLVICLLKPFTDPQLSQGAITRLENLFALLILTGISDYCSTHIYEILPSNKN